MTYFSNLPQTAQDILMIQFEFIGKIFLIGFFFVASIYCVAVWRKKQKDTPYILVALVRTWLYALSWIYIFFTPLFIVYLYPQQGIDTILKFVFWGYRYGVILIGLILFINILFYGPLIIAKLGGLNVMSKNTNRVLDSWLGKYKKYFRRS